MKAKMATESVGEGEGEMGRDEGASSLSGIEIERAKRRCRTLIDRIRSLPSTPPSSPCNRTLLRLIQSELSFLSRFSSSNHNPYSKSLSFNVGYLEAIVHILHQPFIKGVSRVCKPIPLSHVPKNGSKTNSIHVDILCNVNGSPVWFLVSARNPKYISWQGSASSGNKGLRTRVQQVLDAAVRSSPATKPSSIVLCFAHGLDDCIRGRLHEEFGASKFGMDMEFRDVDFTEELEGEWVYVTAASYQCPCVLEIKVDHSNDGVPKTEDGVKNLILSSVSKVGDIPEERAALSLGGRAASSLGGSFCQLLSKMKSYPLKVKDAEFSQQLDLLVDADLVNFDTTALIALISGISNGGTDKLLAKRESELRQRFKSNYEFVIAQVISEIQYPLHVELEYPLSGKRGMICESARSEFKELVSMCGGPNEKSRADHLLKYLMVVPDCPSGRMMSLPTTRKLALKNKVVFGTGDYWRAPTLTANMAFVRAVAQTGMSMFTIEHRPCALVGD